VWTEPRVRAWRAGGVRPPVAVWTAEQTAVFLDTVDTDPMGLLFRLIALRGLRRGEACGLFWSDLDTAADGTTTLTIGRQLVEVRGAPHLTEPKSATSCRTVALDADTACRLADRSRHTGAPDGPMFTTATGRALRPGTVTHRFASLVAAGGLPPVRLHDLRHGAATLALAARSRPQSHPGPARARQHRAHRRHLHLGAARGRRPQRRGRRSPYPHRRRPPTWAPRPDPTPLNCQLLGGR